jgi:hypothetical protein
MNLKYLIETHQRPDDEDLETMAGWLYKAIGRVGKGKTLNDVKKIVSTYFDELVYNYSNDAESKNKDINKVISIWMEKE